MPHLPQGLITIAARRTTPHLSRYALRVAIWRDTELLDMLTFYGHDGRTTRKQAMTWADEAAERYAREYRTAWRSQRDSKLAWHGGTVVSSGVSPRGDWHAIAAYNAKHGTHAR